MKLFRVCFKVRPQKYHPKYYDWEFGFLLVWLFAFSLDDAGERAGGIVAQLPYELVTDEADVRQSNRPERSQEVEQARQVAMQTGISLFLNAMETGTEEGDFAERSFP